MAGEDLLVTDMEDPVDDTVDRPAKDRAQEIEDRYWKRAVGTTSLSERGYRSFWE